MIKFLGLPVIAALLILGAPDAPAAPPPGGAFPLVAQALLARHTLRFIARQDIVLVPPALSAEELTQIVADVTRDRRRVRMTYWLPSDASHITVVDDGRLLRRWEPARRLIVVDQSHEESEATVQRMLALLHRNYRCLRLRRERVNALACDVVAVRPRHGPGPSRLFWIECGRHAILRTEEYDAAGQKRYFSFFESFRFLSRVPAKTFTLPAGPVQAAPRALKDVSGPQTAFSAANVPGRLPAWLPVGYTLIGSAVSGRRHKAALLRYGDGLKTVSVFEEAGQGVTDTDGREATLRRKMARYGQQAWVRGDAALCITILGDVALPDALGQDLLRALSPDSQARLKRGLARDFGTVAPAALRKGWSCEQIAGLGLYLRAHPGWAGAVAGWLRRGQDWPQIAAALHADAGRLDGDARRWIAATLAGP